MNYALDKRPLLKTGEDFLIKALGGYRPDISKTSFHLHKEVLGIKPMKVGIIKKNILYLSWFSNQGIDCYTC